MRYFAPLPIHNDRQLFYLQKLFYSFKMRTVLGMCLVSLVWARVAEIDDKEDSQVRPEVTSY